MAKLCLNDIILAWWSDHVSNSYQNKIVLASDRRAALDDLAQRLIDNRITADELSSSFRNQIIDKCIVKRSQSKNKQNWAKWYEDVKQDVDLMVGRVINAVQPPAPVERPLPAAPKSSYPPPRPQAIKAEEEFVRISKELDMSLLDQDLISMPFPRDEEVCALLEIPEEFF